MIINIFFLLIVFFNCFLLLSGIYIFWYLWKLILYVTPHIFTILSLFYRTRKIWLFFLNKTIYRADCSGKDQKDDETYQSFNKKGGAGAQDDGNFTSANNDNINNSHPWIFKDNLFENASDDFLRHLSNTSYRKSAQTEQAEREAVAQFGAGMSLSAVASMFHNLSGKAPIEIATPKAFGRYSASGAAFTISYQVYKDALKMMGDESEKTYQNKDQTHDNENQDKKKKL